MVGCPLDRPIFIWTVSLDDETGESSCLQEDSGEHGAVQTAGIGVAQRRMVRGQKMEAVWEKIICSVRKR